MYALHMMESDPPAVLLHVSSRPRDGLARWTLSLVTHCQFDILGVDHVAVKVLSVIKKVLLLKVEVIVLVFHFVEFVLEGCDLGGVISVLVTVGSLAHWLGEL